MTKLKAIILACFCLAFLAGVSVGVLWNRLPKKPERHSWLERELGLTPEQREQMREIWSNAMRGGPQRQMEQQRAIRAERDAAIQNLFNEEQKAQYQEIVKRYEEKSAALNAERKAAFERTVEQTRAILTEEQRAKYDALVKQHPFGGPRRRGPGPREGGHGQKDSPRPPRKR